jgi:hypothetical protein
LEKIKAQEAARLKAAEDEARAQLEAKRTKAEEARARKQLEAEEARKKKAEQDLARRAEVQKTLDEKRRFVKASAESTLTLASKATQVLSNELAARRAARAQQDEQRKASQTRLENLRRFAESRERAASAIPDNTVYVCANANCGRDRQPLAKAKCAYCGGDRKSVV